MPKIAFLFLILLTCLFAHAQQEKMPLWKSQYDSATFYWNSNITASIRLLHQAERTAFHDLGIYDENYLVILNNLGLAYGKARDYKKAQEYLEKSLTVQKEFSAEENADVLQVMCNLASSAVMAGNEAKGKKIYLHVLAQASILKLDALHRTATDNLLLLYEAHEQYDSMHMLINAALPSESSNSILKLRLAQARIFRKEKNFAAAKKIMESLHEDIKNEKSPLLMHAVQLESSLLHMEEGQYIQAERELLSLYRQLKSSSASDDQLLTELCNGLGYTYEKLGIYDKAMAYYLESMNRCVAQYGYNSMGCILLQNNIAGIHLKQGRMEQAINQYEEFIRTFTQLSSEKTNNYLSAVNNLASAYRQQGQYDLALQHYNDVYAELSRRNQQDGDLSATVMNNMAVTYTMKADYLVAASSFEKVKAIKEKIYGADSPLLFDLTGNLAVAYWMLKRYEDALPLFQKSLLLSQREMKYVFPHLTEEEQVQFYQHQKQNFERFNSLCMESRLQHPELLTTMSDNQLLLKSITFFTNKRRMSQVSQSSDARLKELMQSLSRKGAQLAQFYQTPIHELTAQGISLTALESEIDQLDKDLSHSLQMAPAADQNISWKQIQLSLKPEEALIELIRFRKYDAITPLSASSSKRVSIGFTDSVYYAALITTQQTVDFPKLVIMKNGSNMEQRNLNFYRNTLLYDVEDTLSYSLYWKAFEPSLEGKKKIFLSNDGVYHKINPNALKDKHGKYLLEKVDIYPLMNSGQLIDRTPSTFIDLQKMVLFGDPDFEHHVSEQTDETVSYDFNPLPGTREELKGISSVTHLGSTLTNTFTGHAANESNLKKVQGPSVLHIATHGFFSTDMVYVNEQARNDFLFHSGIVLTNENSKTKTGLPSTERDGIVTAYDVLQMNLTNTELVVLSACDTGLGKVENGDGVFGLQRSFLQAGAREVVVSLWKCDDAMTKLLMTRFYTHLNEKHTTREALKMAQNDMIANNKSARHWGAFVVVGGY